MYKRVFLKYGANLKDLRKLTDFNVKTLVGRVKTGESSFSKQGRPSGVLQSDYNMKRQRSSASCISFTLTKKDKKEDILMWNKNRTHYKVSNYKLQTFIGCEKYGVALCLNKDKNCFKDFHVA